MCRENLDSYCALQPGIAGAINLTHTAGAYQAFDLVGPESRTRDDCHCHEIIFQG